MCENGKQKVNMNLRQGSSQEAMDSCVSKYGGKRRERREGGRFVNGRMDKT